LAEAGGGLAWQLTGKIHIKRLSQYFFPSDATSCPPLGDWQGYGAVFSCTEK